MKTGEDRDELKNITVDNEIRYLAISETVQLYWPPIL